MSLYPAYHNTQYKLILWGVETLKGHYKNQHLDELGTSNFLIIPDKWTSLQPVEPVTASFTYKSYKLVKILECLWNDYKFPQSA